MCASGRPGCPRGVGTEGTAEWTRDAILAAMNADRPSQVTLTRPIQVILFYVTAAVMPEDGTIHFAEDIYGHDAKLDRALRDTLGKD